MEVSVCTDPRVTFSGCRHSIAPTYSHLTSNDETRVVAIYFKNHARNQEAEFEHSLRVHVRVHEGVFIYIDEESRPRNNYVEGGVLCPRIRVC